jgi:putative transposase
MVDTNKPGLSIPSQCRLLNIKRSSFYYRSKSFRNKDLELMRLIDEQYLKTPHLGISLDEKPSTPTQNQQAGSKA